MWRPKSVQTRLALHLAAVYVVATVIGVIVLVEGAYSTADAAGDVPLAHAIVEEFVADIAWVIPLVMVATMAAGILAIRRGLQPLRGLASEALTIGPGSLDRRLTLEGLPQELESLVASVNLSLDRLEKGFIAQRRFTADAAHQLRTPLSVVTARLETMGGNGQMTALRADLARMNRLVDQLLRVARLESVPLEISGIDLNMVATEEVVYMAPYAIARKRSVAFVGAGAPVVVNGNPGAVSEALRNLIENAIAYTPEGSEVVVSVRDDGALIVEDQGPGIPTDKRELVFTPFWRDKGASHAGAGLGLAIVAETMRALGGSVSIEDANGGGTRFVIALSKHL